MVRDKRLDRACELLRSTELPISEVARRVNFSSENYFYSEFGKLYGTTPLKYRKKYKAENTDN